MKNIKSVLGGFKMKLKLIFSLMIILMAAFPGMLQAQEPDPTAVVIAAFEAFNAGDIETDLAYFADDAVVNIVPFGTYTGHDQIRGWIEKNMSVNGRMTWEILQVNGGTVTLKSSYTDDELQAIGITIEAAEEVTVQNGKIVLDAWIATDESMAALMAAMPPETLPKSGGVVLPSFIVVLALGGLVLLSGLGLGLRRRR
jgi:hypothetical protein